MNTQIVSVKSFDKIKIRLPSVLFDVGVKIANILFKMLSLFASHRFISCAIDGNILESSIHASVLMASELYGFLSQQNFRENIIKNIVFNSVTITEEK